VDVCALLAGDHGIEGTTGRVSSTQLNRRIQATADFDLQWNASAQNASCAMQSFSLLPGGRYKTVGPNHQADLKVRAVRRDRACMGVTMCGALVNSTSRSVMLHTARRIRSVPGSAGRHGSACCWPMSVLRRVVPFHKEH
jgi:hypothetical protein